MPYPPDGGLHGAASPNFGSPRTVILSDQVTMLRGRSVAQVLAIWAAKDPLNIQVRWADFRERLYGATIQSAAAVADPATGVMVVQASVEGTVVALVLAGGEDGAMARIEITITTIDGQTDTVAALLPIIAQGTLTGDTMTASPVITPGANPTPIASIPIVGLAGSTVGIQGQVSARNTLTGDSIGWDFRAQVKNVGTTSSSVSQQSVSVFASDSDMTGCVLAVSVANNVVFLIGTGLAGTTISWSAEYSSTVA